MATTNGHGLTSMQQAILMFFGIFLPALALYVQGEINLTGLIVAAIGGVIFIVKEALGTASPTA